jgi:RHS repeat-associated protein
MGFFRTHETSVSPSKYGRETVLDGYSDSGVNLHNSAGCVTNIQYSGSGYSENIGLSWNSQYQLTEVTTNGVAVERNGFDALGRRVWTWDGTSTNYMVYDGVHVLAEVDSTGGLRRAYTHGPSSTGSEQAGIDNWLAMTVYTGATEKTYFFLTDHQGTVHAVMNETGSIVESYKYDAWGRILGVYNGSGQPLTQSAVGNRYLWQGREYSWQTGLYFFRARWYDPITGRWLSNDPIGISGGLNQYVFCNDNPVNFTDPLGWIGLMISEWLDLGTMCVDYYDECNNAQSKRLSNGQELIDLFNQIKNKGGYVVNLNIKGHGSSAFQSLGGGWSLSAAAPNGKLSGGVNITDPSKKSRDYVELFNSVLAPYATINLNGCKTGWGGDESVAQTLSAALPGRTVSGGAGLAQASIWFTSMSVGSKNVFQNGNWVRVDVLTAR